MQQLPLIAFLMSFPSLPFAITMLIIILIVRIDRFGDYKGNLPASQVTAVITEQAGNYIFICEHNIGFLSPL